MNRGSGGRDGRSPLSTDYDSLFSPKRFAQFLSVGVLGALVDNAFLMGLVELAELSPVIAAVGSKEVSILCMFVINEYWTFASQRADESFRWLHRLMKSNVVRSGGAAVGIVTLFVLNRWFGVWYLAANVVGIGVGFIFNYTFESLVTWRIQDSM